MGITAPGLIDVPVDARRLWCFDLGLVDYEPVQRLQAELRRHIADERAAGTTCAQNGGTRSSILSGYIGVLLLLEHNPVITLGVRASLSDSVRDPSLLRSSGATRLRIVRSERGGLATLHAPGQLVAYPIMPIPARDLRAYVWRLEEVARLVLRRYGVHAARIPGKPGLYVGPEKIASLGLRCERWVASHGTSLNIHPDLAWFDMVVSCGEPDLSHTSLERLRGQAPPLSEVKRAYAEEFAWVFQVEVTPPQEASVEDVWRRCVHPADSSDSMRTPSEATPEVLLDGPGQDQSPQVEKEEMPTAGFEPAAPGSGGQCSIP